MENAPLEKSTALILCDACHTRINDLDSFCNNCGYPMKGSKFEQNSFIAKRNDAEIDLIAFNKRLKNAGNTLFYLAGFFLFATVYNFFSFKDDPQVLAIVLPNVILGILFLVLGEYCKKKPLACMVCGLCLYIIVQLLLFVDNPSINLGDIVELVIIAYLIIGIKSAIDIEKVKKEHNIA